MTIVVDISFGSFIKIDNHLKIDEGKIYSGCILIPSAAATPGSGFLALPAVDKEILPTAVRVYNR